VSTYVLNHTRKKHGSDIPIIYFNPCGPGSSVDTTTDYGLEGSESDPGGDEIFRPFRPGPGAHPASCKMGTGSFPEIEAAGACC